MASWSRFRLTGKEGWGAAQRVLGRPRLHMDINIKRSFRLHSYSFLAQALDYPSTDFAAKLFSPGLVEELSLFREVLEGEEPEVSRLRNALGDLQIQFLEAQEAYSSQEAYLLELQKEYTRLCHVSRPRLVPLFESVYREGKLFQESTIEVVQLYHQAGMKVAEGFSLPPDHIALELEFMAYLCSQEVRAAVDNEPLVFKKARELQQKMLTEHLRFFVPGLARRLQEHAFLGFYKAAGRFLEDFLAWELSCF